MSDSAAVVYLLAGLPGAGKSTFARELERQGVVRLSVDELIISRHGRLGRDYPASQHLDLLGPVVEDAQRLLVEHVRAGRSVVFDHGLSHRSERDFYKRLVTDNGGRWRLVHFPVEMPELLRRLAARNADPDFGTMPAETLEWMAGLHEEPAGEGEELGWVARDSNPEPAD